MLLVTAALGLSSAVIEAHDGLEELRRLEEAWTDALAEEQSRMER